MLLAALATVVIASYYDGDTCTTTNGERIRLACIDSPEQRGNRAQPLEALQRFSGLMSAVSSDRSVFSPMTLASCRLTPTAETDRSLGKVRKVVSDAQREETLITSLIGLMAIFVAVAVMWSVAPQWLTSTWQTL